MNHLRTLLPIAYMTAIYALSSVPGTQDQADTLAGALLQWVTPQWQNLLHIPVYGGLTLSWIWALGTYPLKRHSLMTIAFLLTALWSVLDETHQANVPGRFGSLTDIALNLAGASLAVAYALRRNFPR